MCILEYDITKTPPSRFEISSTYNEMRRRTRNPEYLETGAGKISMCAPPGVDAVLAVVTAPLAAAEIQVMKIEQKISNLSRETDPTPYEYA